MKPLKMFISYAHLDEKYKDRLIDELIVLIRTKQIEIWQDREMLAGADFEKEIFENLNECDVICMLVSKKFIKSNFVWSKELKRALERHEAGEARVIPIVIKPINNYEDLPFAHLNALPRNADPVNKWEDEDEAWENVVQEITRVVKDFQAKGNSKKKV